MKKFMTAVVISALSISAYANYNDEAVKPMNGNEHMKPHKMHHHRNKHYSMNHDNKNNMDAQQSNNEKSNTDMNAADQ